MNRYAAIKVLDSSDATGWCVADRRLGYARLGPADLSKQEAHDLARELNAIAGPGHEGARREVEQQG